MMQKQASFSIRQLKYRMSQGVSEGVNSEKVASEFKHKSASTFT